MSLTNVIYSAKTGDVTRAALISARGHQKHEFYKASVCERR